MTVIKETQNYKLVVGMGSDNKGPAYLLINKKYNVLEIETTMLPQAIIYLNELEVGLIAAEDIVKDNKSAKLFVPPKNVIANKH